MISVNASVLPVAELCPESLHLAFTEGRSAKLWREAFHLGVSEPTTETIELYRIARAHLPDVVSIAVDGAVTDYQEDVRNHVLDNGGRMNLAVTIDLDGRSPAQGTQRIDARIDFGWTSIVSGQPPVATVLQHELIRFASPPPDALDLAAAGIAYAGLLDIEHMKLGRCYHAVGKPPVYRWTPVLGDREMATMWSRITRIFKRERTAVVADHCDECTMRFACRQWKLPMLERAPEALAALMRNAPLVANDVPRVRQLMKALRETAIIAEGQLRAYERRGVA